MQGMAATIDPAVVSRAVSKTYAPLLERDELGCVHELDVGGAVLVFAAGIRIGYGLVLRRCDFLQKLSDALKRGIILTLIVRQDRVLDVRSERDERIAGQGGLRSLDRRCQY